MSWNCDCDENLATYPPGLNFPVDESTSKSSPGEVPQLSIVRWRRSLMDGDLQHFFGKGMALGLAVLFAVFLVFVSGVEGSGSAQKLMRDLGFVLVLLVLEGGLDEGNSKLEDLARENTSLLRSLSPPNLSKKPMTIDIRDGWI